MKDHLKISERTGSKGYQSLRARLDDLGSTFEFLILDVDDGVRVDEAVHKRALSRLHDQITSDQRKWHAKLIESLPPAPYPEPTVPWDLEKAVGQALSPDLIYDLVQTRSLSISSPSLYEEFCRSLYLDAQRIEVAKIHPLFREWVDALGIRARYDAAVFNWDNVFERPSRFPGSWPQRGWCLTIWNPARRTIAALATCLPHHK